MIAVDTSVVVALVLASHPSHEDVHGWALGRELHLAGHAEVESFSVLTRLPGDARLAPADAAALLRARFVGTLRPVTASADGLVDELVARDVRGGAAYDALVAIAARDHGAVLATRDGRAVGTYGRVGVEVALL